MISMGSEVWPKCSTTIQSLDQLIEAYDIHNHQQDSIWLRSFIIFADYGGNYPVAYALMLVDKERDEEDGVILYEMHRITLKRNFLPNMPITQDVDVPDLKGIDEYLDAEPYEQSWYENGYCKLSQKELQQIYEKLFSLSESGSGSYLEEGELWAWLTKSTGGRPILLYVHTYLPSYESINNQDIKYWHLGRR
jgi:hypothetical protein